MNADIVDVEVGISFTAEVLIHKKELRENYTEEDIKNLAIYEAYSRYDKLECEDGIGELNIINCDIE